MEKYMCIDTKTDSIYELPLEDLLKELEENGIDTSKLNIIENTEENRKYCINYFASLVKWLRLYLFTVAT
jgi:hypothetical protein